MDNDDVLILWQRHADDIYHNAPIITDILHSKQGITNLLRNYYFYKT
jgi:hypothetical protein